MELGALQLSIPALSAPRPIKRTQVCLNMYRAGSVQVAGPAPRRLSAGGGRHLEGQIERLAGVEPGVAGRGVAQLELVLEHLVGPPQALGDVVAGELDVHAARPRPFGPAGGEELSDLGQDVVEVAGLAAARRPVKVLPCIGSQAHTTGWPASRDGVAAAVAAGSATRRRPAG